MAACEAQVTQPGDWQLCASKRCAVALTALSSKAQFIIAWRLHRNWELGNCLESVVHAHSHGRGVSRAAVRKTAGTAHHQRWLRSCRWSHVLHATQPQHDESERPLWCSYWRVDGARHHRDSFI